jgi:hypothetical protein
MLERIDSAARAETRSRSSQITHLLRLALGDTGTATAADHLRGPRGSLESNDADKQSDAKTRAK